MFWVHLPVPVSPFPFPIHIPPPSFLFLFWGPRNFLFSSRFKMACWYQLETQLGAGHPSPGDGHRGRERRALSFWKRGTEV